MILRGMLSWGTWYEENPLNRPKDDNVISFSDDDVIGV